MCIPNSPTTTRGADELYWIMEIFFFVSLSFFFFLVETRKRESFGFRWFLECRQLWWTPLKIESRIIEEKHAPAQPHLLRTSLNFLQFASFETPFFNIQETNYFCVSDLRYLCFLP
jgi:hypothetical protein